MIPRPHHPHLRYRNMTWPDWLDECRKLAAIQGATSRVVERINYATYRTYYEDGMSPAKACFEDCKVWGPFHKRGLRDDD